MEGIKEPKSSFAPSKVENGCVNKSATDLLKYVYTQSPNYNAEPTRSLNSDSIPRP